MGREWQIGDSVDYTTDGWMDAQNWGHGQDDDDERGINNIENSSGILKGMKLGLGHILKPNPVKGI